MVGVARRRSQPPLSPRQWRHHNNSSTILSPIFYASLFLLLVAGLGSTAGASHSSPEVKGSILRTTAAGRALLDDGRSRPRVGGRRKREGRAEILDFSRGVFDGADDLSLEALAPPSPGERHSAAGDDAGDPGHLVPAALGSRRDDDDGAPDDGDGISIQLSLPSFDDYDGGLSGDGSYSSLTSFLSRTPSSRLSFDVSPAHVPPVPPSEAQNRLLSSANLPPLRKTGTTIVGVLCDSGRTVVIGADTRATDGTVVADKRCEKVHRLADNVWCCGAGTSGDIDALVRRVKYTFLLRGLVAGSIGNGPMDAENNDGYGEEEDAAVSGTNSYIEGEQGLQRLPFVSVSAVCRYIRDRLYEGGGSVGANLVLGGYDPRSGRAVLTAIHPHGSMDVVPYTALGSGGLAATAVLESRYPRAAEAAAAAETGDQGGASLSVEEAIELVRDAVGAGIAHDMGSGSQVDLCVIGPRGTMYRRAVVPEEELPRGGRGEEEVEMVLGERHAASAEDGNDVEAKEIIMSGVNGFGSLPYFVKSRRMLMEGEDAIRESRRDELDVLLGLDAKEDMGSDEKR